MSEANTTELASKNSVYEVGLFFTVVYCYCFYYNSNSNTITDCNNSDKILCGESYPLTFIFVLEDTHMKCDKYRQGNVYVQKTVL